MPSTPELIKEARTFAESMDHGYVTVSHVLAVAFSNHPEVHADLVGFLRANVPQALPGDYCMPTQGVLRVSKRLASGDSVVEAVMKEGDQAHGPHFLRKHGLVGDT